MMKSPDFIKLVKNSAWCSSDLTCKIVSSGTRFITSLSGFISAASVITNSLKISRWIVFRPNLSAKRDKSLLSVRRPDLRGRWKRPWNCFGVPLPKKDNSIVLIPPALD